MKNLRKLVSQLVIIAFSCAALLGILALVQGGEFGELEGQVLATTVVVGFFSLATLCYLSTTGTRWVPVGIVGALTSLIPLTLALLTIWTTASSSTVEIVFGVSLTIALTLAQLSLLIGLNHAGNTWQRSILVATSLAAVVVASMISIAIINPDLPTDGFWRGLGITAILDALGTVVLIALGFIAGRRSAPAAILTPELEERIRVLARQRGVAPQQLVGDALSSYSSRSRASTTANAALLAPTVSATPLLAKFKSPGDDAAEPSSQTDIDETSAEWVAPAEPVAGESTPVEGETDDTELTEPVPADTELTAAQVDESESDTELSSRDLAESDLGESDLGESDFEAELTSEITAGDTLDPQESWRATDLDASENSENEDTQYFTREQLGSV